jgi:hypothetical protein
MDAWQKKLSYNPNIILLVKRQVAYGCREGGSGRLVVLDHPLRIALFEGNFRGYQPPYSGIRLNPPRVIPPISHTPQYPQTLSTVLLLSHGGILRLHRLANRGCLNHGRLSRVDVERTPSLTPETSSDDRLHMSDTPTDNTSHTAGSSLPHVKSESAVTPEGWGIPYSESPPLSYSDNYPLRPHNPTSLTRTACNSEPVLNLAVFNTSGSIVQGGNV